MSKGKYTSIHIGADEVQVRKVLPELTKAIIQIINSPGGDEVKKKALEMLAGSYEVKNCIVQNCNFVQGETKTKEGKV